MAKLSINELQSFIAGYVTEAKVSNPSYTQSRDNIVGLLDKIGKIMTFDTSYMDKLAIFNGEELSFAKDVEEWQQDLVLPQDYDPTGANALAPAYPSYRPATYSKTLGRKVIKTTRPYNDIERAVHFEEQFISITEMIMKRLYDSYASWRYAVKREGLGLLCDMCASAMAPSSTFATATAYSVGDYVKDSNSVPAVVVKPIASSNAKTFAQLVAEGTLIQLDLVEEVAVPEDETTGAKFIEAVKHAVEVASDISEGHSLNGNTLGASEGLVLIVKQGIAPVLDTEVLAGAFHQDRVALPANLVVIPAIPSTSGKAYAILMDSRGLRLFNSYRSVKDQLNAEGDFMNYFLHSEDTMHISRNTFVKVFVSE